jgi:L-fuconolactonase
MSISRRNVLFGTLVTGLSTGVRSQPSEQSRQHDDRMTAQLNRLPNEPALEPDMLIIDPHHHLWFISESVLEMVKASKDPISQALAPVTERMARYLFEEYLRDIQDSGHNVVATVYMEAGSMYRAHGPETIKSVGEVEFANGVAAMAASEEFGTPQICAGIVSAIPTTTPDAAARVLSEHVRAGNGRLRGVRAHLFDEIQSGRSFLDEYRSTVRTVQKLGLSLDIGAIEPRLREVLQLARAFPDQSIILDHVGLPYGIGRYERRREGRYPLWLDQIRELAKCPNVTVKLGGLGMPIAGLPSYMSRVPATSAQLAQEWKLYIQPCIDEFGADRCMFESDFPADALTCSYSTVWNAFKLLAASGSSDEKRKLFHGTAQRVYKLSLASEQA